MFLFVYVCDMVLGMIWPYISYPTEQNFCVTNGPLRWRG